MSDRPSFFEELKRRRVFRAAALYAVVAFVIAQAADLLVPGLLLPDWTFRLVIVLLVLGFPVALVLAWAFDITPEGVIRADASTATSTSRVRSRWWTYAGTGVVVTLFAVGGYAYLSQGSDGPTPLQGAGVGERQVIAVLPLTSMVGGEENEYFADGITEDILMNLGLVPEFAVISRTSVMRYKGTDRSIPEIAAELGAAYVLEGSLRRVGDQIRVVLQLIEPASDTPIWASTMDRRIEDIFQLQSQIAHSVVDALRIELASAVEARLDRPPTSDLAAYDLFLRARDRLRMFTPEAVDEAIETLQEVVNRDPDFALAHAVLGAAYATRYYNLRTDRTALQFAFESARRAIELQPDLGDGHRALGTAYSASGRFAEAIPALERAIDLNPSDAAALNNLGLSLGMAGDWDRALEVGKRAAELDPVQGFVSNVNLAHYYRILGMFDRGRAAARRSVEINPDYWGAPYVLAWIDLAEDRPQEAAERAIAASSRWGQHLGANTGFAWALLAAGAEAEALPLLESVHAQAPDMAGIFGPAPAVHLAYLVHRAGDVDRALHILDRIEGVLEGVIATGDATPSYPYSMAGAAAIRGDWNAALGWLETSVERGWNQPAVVEREPFFADLRQEPRFQALLEHMEKRIEAQRRRVEVESD